MTANTASSGFNSSNLTIEHFREMLKVLDALPKIPVGIVARPQFVEWCRLNLHADSNKIRAEYGLAALPVYAKVGMIDDYQVFYSHEELRAFLK